MNLTIVLLGISNNNIFEHTKKMSRKMRIVIHSIKEMRLFLKNLSIIKQTTKVKIDLKPCKLIRVITRLTITIIIQVCRQSLQPHRVLPISLITSNMLLKTPTRKKHHRTNTQLFIQVVLILSALRSCNSLLPNLRITS